LSTFPVVVEIEPTTACTVCCAFCPRQSLQRASGELSEETFNQILENLGSPFEQGMLLFSGFGEPMLHLGLDSLLRLAKERGWFCGITTNGILLSPARAELLVAAGLDVLQVSLPAASRQTYETIVRDGAYDKVVDGVHAVLQQYRDQMMVVLNFTMIPQNRHETASFASYWKGQGVHGINFSPCHTRGGFMRDGALRRDPVMSAAHRDCWYRRNVVFVTWEGRPLACCNDLTGETVTGDLRTTGFHEIQKQALGQGSGAVYRICRECDLPFR